MSAGETISDDLNVCRVHSLSPYILSTNSFDFSGFYLLLFSSGLAIRVAADVFPIEPALPALPFFDTVSCVR